MLVDRLLAFTRTRQSPQTCHPLSSHVDGTVYQDMSTDTVTQVSPQKDLRDYLGIFLKWRPSSFRKQPLIKKIGVDFVILLLFVFGRF